MKKFTAKFLLILIILRTIFQFGIYEESFAATNNWDFISSANYTLSWTTSFEFTWWLATLNQNTLVHTWVITNATNYNWAYDVVVEWNYAYMTSYLWNRVVILDISNPTNPILTWSILNNWWTIRLAWPTWLIKSWNYLYVSSNTSDALQVIDVTNPSTPTATWQLVDATNLNWARWIAKSWNYLYVTADARDALNVIDVSNPNTPTRVWWIRNTTTLNWARDVKIAWNYAYVSAYDWDRFTVVDITTPTAPTVAANINDATNLNWAWWVELSWNYAYISAYLNNSVRIIDITTPTAPTAVTNISGWSYSLSNPRDLLADNNKLYITSFWSNAVNVADITTPTAPTYVTKILHNAANPLLNWAYWLFKLWNLIYTAAYTSDALEILKLNYDTTSPNIIPITPYNYWILNWIQWFSETLWASNQGSITYQISKNWWSTWYYLSWSTWTVTTWGVINSDSASSINSNLGTFNSLPWWTWIFSFKAFFTSNWDQKVELDNILVTSSDPASPGWVSTNMSLWLKWDKWTSTTTDWASLVSWWDQSWNWLDAWWGVSPTYIYNSWTWNLNFNPIIDFNWTQYLDNLANWAYSKNYFMVIVPDNQIDWTIAWQLPFGFDCTSWVLSSWTCWLPFAWLTLWAFTIAINDEVVTHAIWSSTNWRSSQIWAASYDISKPMLLSINENSGANGTDIYEKWVKINNTAVNTYQTLWSADYRIWRSLDPANIYPYDGKVAEIINYSGSISITDRKKIESYLALKYGITLNNWTQNYLASDWTTSIWSTWSAWAYTHDIFGIWRDDTSLLWQVKSKSIENDWIITMQAIWEWTNTANSFVDIADKEFLTISDDWSSNTWIQSWSPTWYSILSRQWKTQETWDVGTISLDFDVANSNFDIPLLSTWSSYYFIYDSNNNSSLTDETPQVMTNTTWNIWQISWVNLSDNQIFTIATQSTSNNIPTNINLSNNTINENISPFSTVWNLTTTDSDPLDTHTYSLVNWIWSNDNSKFSITWSTLMINESPDYEIKNNYSLRIQTDDWNWWQYQKQFSVWINNIWELVNSILDFESPWKYTVTSWIWTRTLTNPQEWLYSIESNNNWVINSQSCFEVNNTFTQTGTISFEYNVSSQATSDFLRFSIDNVELQNWSWTVPWTQYTNTGITTWTHAYKWCYTKDWAWSAWSDKAWIDYITFQNSTVDTTPPSITSINHASWSLLPWWNHNLIINYNDTETGINTGSSIITLQKWSWSSWWSDISTSWLNLTWKTIWLTSATYPTNNLDYWKYYYTFQISDNNWNSSSTWAIFYIDRPEITISTWSLNIWNLTSNITSFSSDEIIVTIKTVWAPFQVILNKTSTMNDWNWNEIINWNWTKWIWYDKFAYSGTISTINTNEVLWNQSWSININWDLNTYTYKIKMWALIETEQADWIYQSNLSFWLNLTY